MPFKSEAQRKYLWAKHPSLAKKWSHEYPGQKNLPEHKHKKEHDKAAGMLTPTLMEAGKLSLMNKILSAKLHGLADSQGQAIDGLMKHNQRLLKNLAATPGNRPEPTDEEPTYNKRLGLPVVKLSASQPPHYRDAADPSESCAACQSYDKMSSRCLRYGVPVQPNYTCDAFDAISIDTKAIANAGPVQPAKPIDTKDTGPSFGSLKLGAAKRPDRYNQMNDWLTGMTHHPTSVSGSFTIPMRSAIETRDKTDLPYDHENPATDKKSGKKMSTKEAFKSGFLLRCADDQLTMDQLTQRIDGLLATAKQATWGGAGGAFLGRALQGLLGVGGTLIGEGARLGAGAAVVAPIAAGGLIGYGASRYKSGPDAEDLKHDDLRNEYLRLADSIKRKAAIKRIQDENPSSIVQLT